MRGKGLGVIIRSQIRNRGFQRFFVSAFLILTALLAAMFSFYIQQKKENLSEAAQVRANQAFINLQGALNSIQSNTVFLGTLNSVEKMVNTPSPRGTNIGLNELKAVAEDICSFTDYSSCSSVELFFNEIEKVYVSDMGFYSYSDYYDPGLLSALLDENMDDRWLIGRSYSRYYGAQYPQKVLTYVRRLPLFNSSSRGFVTVNMTMDELYAQILKGLDSGGLTVCWQDETIIDRQNGEAILSVSTESSLITCTAYVTRDQLWRAAGRTVVLLGVVYLALLGLCFFLAVWYSVAVDMPARELLRKLGVRELDDSVPDIYGELEDAIDALSGQLSNMRQTMRQNRPLVQEQLLIRLVCREGELGKQLDECARCGITFPHALFAVVLLDMSCLDGGLSGDEREQLVLLCRESCLQAYSELGRAYAASGENGSQVFLLNAAGSPSTLESRILSACQEVSQKLEGVFSFGLRFSVGLCDEESPSLYRTYLGARRGLSYTSADSEGFVVFSRQADGAPYADSQLVEELAQTIFRREPKQLDALLGQHQRWYLRDDFPVRQARQAANLCLCSVYGRLLEGDYQAGESSFSAAAKKLSQAETPGQCHDTLSEYFHSLIHSHEKVSDRSYAYVCRAVAYIEAHYSRNFAIPEMAEELSINPVYLNKIFKLAKGKTVSEYLNFYRISVSIPMMRDESRTISEISSAVGYPDVRNYIRFFKKFYEVTPSEYRRRMKAGELEET